MRSQHDRSYRWGVVLLVTALLAACSGPDDDGDAAAPTGAPQTAAASPTPTAPPSPTAPPAPLFLAESVNDLGKLCGTASRVYQEAAAYVGPGPHPIAIFSREVGSAGYEQRYVFKPGFEPEQPQEVALLACLTGVRTGASVGRCRYRTDGGTRSVRVDAQRFTVEVYALNSGQRVARTVVNADFCPPTLLTDRDGSVPRRMTSTLNDEHLYEVLTGVVSRPAS